MKGIGGLRAISQVVTTGNGQPLHYPFLDDTEQEGAWIAEGSGPVAQQNPTSVSESVLDSYLASSKQILLSIMLLGDSNFNLENVLLKAFSLRLSRITETAYATATAAGQPTGLIPAIVTAGNIVTAVGNYSVDGISSDLDSVGYDDLCALITALDSGYRPGVSFLAAQSTIDFLRTCKDKVGRPVWPALTQGDPTKILGYPWHYANYGVSGIGAGNVSMVFGNFDYFAIRDVVGIELARLSEIYMVQNQCGFQSFLRTDSQVLDTNAFQVLRHPSS